MIIINKTKSRIFLKALYFVLFVALIFVNLGFVLWMGYRIVKEILEPAIDLLKVVQSALVMVCFANWIYGFIQYSCYLSTNYMSAKIVFVTLLSSLYFYYAVNCVACYLLIYHVNTLKLLRDGKEYQECRKKIRAAELKALIFLTSNTVFEIVYLLTNITLVIMSYYNEFILKEVNRIISCQLILIFTFLSIWQFYLYRQLPKVMKADLNYYFKQKCERLSFIMRINVLYFLIFLAFNLTFFICELDIYRMIGMYNPYNRSIRIVFLCSYIIANISQYLFVYFNFYVINFKDWTFDLLSGYKQLQYYKSSSIFILSNCMNKVRLSSFSKLSNDDSENESVLENQETITIDYEVNDDYMKNYKINYTRG